MTSLGGGGPPVAEPLLIFPYNGNAIEAADCLHGRFRLLGYVDDTPAKQGRHPRGDLVHSRRAFREFPHASVLAVVGSPISYLRRSEVINSLELDPRRFARVIHPGAHISSTASIGFDVLIGPGVVIGSNVTIGNHVCILPNSVIHHDACIEDWSLIGSNVTVAGHTVVGTNCYIGSGTSLMNNIRVGDRALVGLGSCVLRDVLPGRRVAGNPHRYLD
jgi:sugar O-acyltransferase (sialic acid O-acetyltransferase NeuD family)